MTTTTLEHDLASLVELHLVAPLADFGLQLLAAAETEAVLSGPTYALHLYAARDEFDLLYIERDAKGALVEYSLRHFVMARFNAEDWSKAAARGSDPERVRGLLEAYASGLSNRCADLLRGEKSWLRREGWRAPAPSAFATRALNRMSRHADT